MRVFKKHITRYLDADGHYVSKDTPGARKIKEKNGKWYGRVPGNAKAVPLCTNKAAAEIMLGELVRKAEMVKAGITDPFEPHRRRPLSEHLDDYEVYLLAKGDGFQHVRDTMVRVRRVAAGCGFAFIADVSLSAVQKFLAHLAQKRPTLPSIDPAQESYSKKELAAALLVKPHCIGPLVRRWNLPAEGQGRRRRFSRQTALALRERLSQPVGPATINHHVRAIKGFTHWLVRDRRTADNPLAGLSGVNADADDVLRSYLAGKPARAVVWPGTWSEDAAQMLRLDLEAAGVAYVAEGVNGAEYRDFHARRHSFVALLDRAGCTLKEAMQLARHSDPKLTMKRYGKAQLHDLAGKVEQLPNLLGGSPSDANEQKATGTDGGTPEKFVAHLLLIPLLPNEIP